MSGVRGLIMMEGAPASCCVVLSGVLLKMDVVYVCGGGMTRRNGGVCSNFSILQWF